MKNCSFNDKLVGELETCQNNMTHFFYEVVRTSLSPQIASEVVARGGRNWNKVTLAKNFAQKKSRHHSTIRL